MGAACWGSVPEKLPLEVNEYGSGGAGDGGFPPQSCCDEPPTPPKRSMRCVG